MTRKLRLITFGTFDKSVNFFRDTFFNFFYLLKVPHKPIHTVINSQIVRKNLISEIEQKCEFEFSCQKSINYLIMRHSCFLEFEFSCQKLSKFNKRKLLLILHLHKKNHDFWRENLNFSGKSGIDFFLIVIF